MSTLLYSIPLLDSSPLQEEFYPESYYFEVATTRGVDILTELLIIKYA